MGSGTANSEDWWSCDSKAVRVKQLRPLSGNVEGSYEVEYRPIVLPTGNQTSEHTLKISTKELGEFKVKLQLTAQPPSSRPILRFEVPLGSVQAETFALDVYNRAKCDFACSISNAAVFNVQKTLTVEAVARWEGEAIKLSVAYDPFELGEKRDLLKITHPDGGSYECELIGSCIPPSPQGPFLIAAGSATVIPFRNCFTSAMTWTFTVDSPCFKLQTASASVGPKAEGVCNVSFEPKSGASSTAKLFITCGSYAPWVYYLKGPEPIGNTKVSEKLMK
jgi:hypothetical protein